MSFGETVLLGATRRLHDLPGPARRAAAAAGARARVALAMFSVGVLAFLLVDVLEHGFAIVEDAVEGFKDGEGSFARRRGWRCSWPAASRGHRRARHPRAPDAGAQPAAADRGRRRDVVGREHQRLPREARRRQGAGAPDRHDIAAAIGLHNFAEGLAIGVSARAGEIALATVLIIGFALHNATEGFGIIGPLGDVRPSWRWLRSSA